MSRFLPILTLASLGWFVAVSPGQAPMPPKRVLTHADYDIWNTATGMTLAPNGRFVAYILTPPQGDVTLIVRDLVKNSDFKFPMGRGTIGLPIPPASDEEETEELVDQQPVPPTTPGTTPPTPSLTGSPTFTPDSKFLYFPLIPTRAEVEKAKSEKKKPEESPRTVLAVLDLQTGQIAQRITGITSFSIVGEGAGILLTKKEAKPEPKPEEKKPEEKKPETAPMPKSAEKKGEEKKPDAEVLYLQALYPDAFGDNDQRPKFQPPGTTPGGTPGTPPTPRAPSGTDLVIRDLASGKEQTLADVLEYNLTRDFKHITYTVASKKPETNGVYFAALFGADAPTTVKAGAGRYSRLTWNDKQTQLAFFFDDLPTPPAKTTPPDPKNPDPKTPTPPTSATASKVRVYLWDRAGKAPAVEVLSPTTPGLKAGWQIVDRGGLNFSADGLKLSVGTVKPAERPTELPKKSEGPGAPTATPDRFELDLWHWKDEAIQPMQKLRSATDRLRTYRAVYFLDTKQFKHVQDDDLTIGVPDFGDWTLAGSDKKYRGQTWQFPIPRDYTLVNIRTAESKPLKTAFVGNFGSSPKGTYYTTFDGKDWLCVRVPDGKVVNLTAKVPGVKFFNEQFDSPSVAPPYGALGWSADEKAFFVYDNCDIWRLAPDGSDATRLTQGGLTGTRFRFSRVEKPFDPKAEPERGLDTTKPWLLSAEDTATHDTGYYRLEPGQKPKLLVMGARKYGPTVKARQADVLLFTVETFQNFPDFFVSNSNFHDIRRITDINPRVAEFNWGKAELLNFQSTEGQAMKAMVVKPENFDPKKKYPMVVYIYERLSENLHNFRIPSVRGGQIINPTYYASNGYIVLMPDIAYRTGQPGQSAIRCVLPAIQAMVDQGCVNEKAIGINGQSWGGYQIAYMVTQTNRFKAAVAGAPVSNMVSAYNGIRWGSGLPRQFQYEKTQSRIGETLWQAPFKYIENSPVFQADRVQTPLMMIHNDQDDAVPWYQGIEYYLALRRLNKEVYLLNYNGQPHNLTNRAAARDFAVRMQQFFDHHLKGAPMPEWMAKGVPYLEREKEKEQIRRLLQSPEKK